MSCSFRVPVCLDSSSPSNTLGINSQAAGMVICGGLTSVPVDPLVVVVNEPLASTCVSRKKTAAYFQAKCTFTSLHGHVRLLNALSEVVETTAVQVFASVCLEDSDLMSALGYKMFLERILS